MLQVYLCVKNGKVSEKRVREAGASDTWYKWKTIYYVVSIAGDNLYFLGCLL